MNIQETAQAIRANQIEINNCTSQVRLVRLTDKRWDLTARYKMLLRLNNLKAA